jgi:hypothetical protein
MHILREEADKTLDESEDVTEFGTTLMAQYEGIGGDLKSLMGEWEVGKEALKGCIDRNEKRISSMSFSGAMGHVRSPTISLSGTTAAGGSEGSPSDALKALEGNTERSSMESTESDREVYEGMSQTNMARKRSTMPREVRIAKMHEERERIASLREKADANTHMIHELENVIKLRPLRMKSVRRDNASGALNHQRITSL